MYGNIFDRNDCWESGLEQIKNCDKAPKEIIVYLKPNVKKKIDILMDKYPHREWLAYLVGDKTKNIVEDIFFPKQKATSGNVDDIVFPNNISVIGVIHSHHSMSHGFSPTDDEYINGNHDISICVSHNGIGGNVRWNTPCGCKKTVTAKIKIWWPTDFNEDEFNNDVEEKMKEPEVRIYRPGNIYPGTSYWNTEKDNDEPNVPSASNSNDDSDNDTGGNDKPTLRDAITGNM